MSDILFLHLVTISNRLFPDDIKQFIFSFQMEAQNIEVHRYSSVLPGFIGGKGDIRAIKIMNFP
jgi:hypothetical protein